MLSTAQLSSFHSLDSANIDLQINGSILERVTTTKLLGCHLNEHLKWEDNVKYTASSCYYILATLKKLKKILPFRMRKNIVQALVLSKLYYNDVIYHSLPEYLQKRLEQVLKACASFVVGKYASLEDVLSLKWLPIREHREWNLLKITHKALYNKSWPGYLQLRVHEPTRVLRSSNGVQLQIPLERNTLQDHAAQLFNELPSNYRNIADFISFSKQSKHFMFLKAKGRIMS